jgi:hypothetical protein
MVSDSKVDVMMMDAAWSTSLLGKIWLGKIWLGIRTSSIKCVTLDIKRFSHGNVLNPSSDLHFEYRSPFIDRYCNPAKLRYVVASAGCVTSIITCSKLSDVREAGKSERETHPSSPPVALDSILMCK